MDWNIRVTRGNSSPVNIPEELVERVHGNPLAATLMSQLIDKFPVDSILENTSVKQRKAFAEYMSIFNTPVTMEAIEMFTGEGMLDLIDSLTDYFILQYNLENGSYIMHPLVREFFVRETPPAARLQFHKIAADYYNSRTQVSDANPVDKAEHVSHLVASLQWDEATELKYVYVDELRPVARSLFKAKQYGDSLKYYRVLDRLKEDPDIKFHLALCYAHQEEWPKAERAISDAIGLAPDAWWILSGYGDVLCKKRHLSDAEKYLNQALEIMDQDSQLPKTKYSAVYQSLGAVYEASGLVRAEEYYLHAIKCDPDSAFAHCRYAKYLYRVKKDVRSARLHLATAKEIDSSLRQIHLIESEIATGQAYEMTDEHDEEEDDLTTGNEVEVRSID